MSSKPYRVLEGGGREGSKAIYRRFMATNRRIPVLIGDAVGVGHFVVCNALVVVAQFLPFFQEFGGRYPGLNFIYRTIDAPVYQLLQSRIDAQLADSFYSLLWGELVVVLSSALYGVLAYLIVKFLAVLTE